MQIHTHTCGKGLAFTVRIALIVPISSVRSVFLSSFSFFFFFFWFVLNTEATLSFVPELELKGKLFQLLTLEWTSSLHPIQTGLNETLPGCVTSCDRKKRLWNGEWRNFKTKFLSVRFDSQSNIQSFDSSFVLRPCYRVPSTTGNRSVATLGWQ